MIVNRYNYGKFPHHPRGYCPGALLFFLVGSSPVALFSHKVKLNKQNEIMQQTKQSKTKTNQCKMNKVLFLFTRLEIDLM